MEVDAKVVVGPVITVNVGCIDIVPLDGARVNVVLEMTMIE